MGERTRPFTSGVCLVVTENLVLLLFPVVPVCIKLAAFGWMNLGDELELCVVFGVTVAWLTFSWCFANNCRTVLAARSVS